MKLNVLLALRSPESSRFNQNVGTQLSNFKKDLYDGEVKTFDPMEGFEAKSSDIINKRVASTVNEQFEWFLKEALKYINTTITIESANGEGAHKVPLEFEGKTYGPYPATVLLRLHGIIADDKFNQMLCAVPTRDDKVAWEPANEDEQYKKRGIVQTVKQSGEKRETETHEEILKDPNIDPQHIPSGYRAMTTRVSKSVKSGNYTHQKFSGAWSPTQKAELIARRSALLDALTAALQKVNDREVEEVKMDELFNHLIFG